MPFHLSPLRRFAANRASVAWPMALLLLGSFWSSSAGSVISPVVATESVELRPEPETKHRKAFKLVNYMIERYHYKEQQLDDAFSKTVLASYLKQLDPNRSFFLAQDIAEFDKLSGQFDDYIREARLEPAYEIFDIYRTRVGQRSEFALARLLQPFDFQIDEYFPLDREESPWAASQTELDDLWRRRIKNDILNLRLAGKNEPEIEKTLARRYTHLARRMMQLTSDDVFQIYVNAYIGSIEPHTSYFSPRATENFKIHMRLSLEGIGAVLQTDNEYTQIRSVVPGGPADLGGELKSGDRIIGVGQEQGPIEDVIGWRLDDVVDLIRGAKGTVVQLEILPKAGGLEGPSRKISIVRDEIKLEDQAAKKEVMEVESSNGQTRIGIIDLPSFYIDFDAQLRGEENYRSTTRDVRQLLAELQQEELDGLVIDLRGNGGGALTEAISLTGLFIRKGPVVQVQESSGDIEVDTDPDPEIVYDGPLAVLVDRNSASASEIFAGAIQDYRRGLVIGEPTFGKGTVQNLIKLDRFSRGAEPLGQLKLTIAQFFRVNGDSTQHRGVIPDIVWPTAGYDSDNGERSLENALPWRHIEQATFTPFREIPSPDIFGHTRTLHRERIADRAEFRNLIEALEFGRQQREKKEVTLLESKRELERKLRDEERLRLENGRRFALGLEQITSVQDLEDPEQEVEAIPDNSKYDIFLQEASRILTDYIAVSNRFITPPPAEFKMVKSGLVKPATVPPATLAD